MCALQLYSRTRVAFNTRVRCCDCKHTIFIGNIVIRELPESTYITLSTEHIRPLYNTERSLKALGVLSESARKKNVNPPNLVTPRLNQTACVIFTVKNLSFFLPLTLMAIFPYGKIPSSKCNLRVLTKTAGLYQKSI